MAEASRSRSCTLLMVSTGSACRLPLLRCIPPIPCHPGACGGLPAAARHAEGLQLVVDEQERSQVAPTYAPMPNWQVHSPCRDITLDQLHVLLMSYGGTQSDVVQMCLLSGYFALCPACPPGTHLGSFERHDHHQLRHPGAKLANQEYYCIRSSEPHRLVGSVVSDGSGAASSTRSACCCVGSLFLLMGRTRTAEGCGSLTATPGCSPADGGTFGENCRNLICLANMDRHGLSRADARDPTTPNKWTRPRTAEYNGRRKALEAD